MDRSERLDLGDEDQVKLHEEIEPNSDEYEYEDGPDMVEDEEMNGQDGPAMNGELPGREEEDQEDAVQRQEAAQARRKRKEFEVFVGGLDRDATEEDLRKVFGEVGEITEVRLMKIPMTQKNKGFAFLRFATVEQARRAVNELKHPVVNGKQCGVSPSQDSDTLFVGNICRTWTKEVLKDKLAKYGVDKFEELTLVEDAKNEGMNRGFAFLDFSSRPDALDACKQLQKRDVTLGTDRPAKVAFADTFIEPDDEIMAQVRTVFLDGLPPNWDEERVIDYLTKFGKIEKAELARNMPAAKRQDFGFITFDTHDAAVACVEGINSAELNDGDKKIKVRARLSRPRQRVRPGRQGGGGYHGHSGSRGGRAFWGPSSRVDSWNFSGRNARGIEGRSAYRGGYRWTENTGDRYLVADEGLDRVGSRRHLPPLEKFVDRRSPPYAKVSWKRDYMRHDEPYSRSSDFASRAGMERHLSYRDHVYSSRGPDYFESPSGASRSASRRSSLYVEESYGQRAERPSNYRDSQTRDYSSISGRKRPHSPMDDIPLRYVDSIGRNTRTRYNYGASSAAVPYGESDHYAPESSRLGRESNLEYDGESRRSAGRSHGLYDSHTTSMSYSRGGVSKGDTGGMYSSYGRDYLSRGEDLGGDSYSSMYSSRGMNDGYVSGRGSYY